MKLNDIACKGAKPKDKPYKKFDGGGLYLLIKPNGSKLWDLKYRYLKKEKTLSLGQSPLVSLAEAERVGMMQRNYYLKILTHLPSAKK